MIKNPPIIKKVVREMGGTIEKVIPERGYFYIKFGDQRIFVSRKFKIANNLISGSEITKYKDLTYLLLKENNLPTPMTICFYRKSFHKDQLDQLAKIKFPIVIKDAQGSNSKGVFTNIKNEKDAAKIIRKELNRYPALLAQEMIFGKEYRVLVLDHRIIGALELIPPRILGDGKSTVKKLITSKQNDTEKRTPFDGALTAILKEQGFTLSSIPPENKEVYIKKNSCLAEGGETNDVTDLIHPSISQVCVKATQVAGKYLAGIDVMCKNISQEVNDQFFNIIEINGKPDIYIHYDPTHGMTRNVVKDIIEFILKTRRILKLDEQ